MNITIDLLNARNIEHKYVFKNQRNQELANEYFVMNLEVFLNLQRTHQVIFCFIVNSLETHNLMDGSKNLHQTSEMHVIILNILVNGSRCKFGWPD